MAIFKCKMCGGTLEVNQGESTGVCEYCGTEQTLPRLDDERKVNLYDRANHFRRNNDFDKAMGIYEQILNEDGTDAEAYWSLVLCRYGIEYVEDPATKKRIPTVNRAQYTSIYADEDYKSALQYADTYQKSIYEAEAKAIDEIQKGILEISQKEEPFDVFICYKETGNDGRRTPDSVLATELYHELTREGFKVFFSRITLEDKLGTAYEPYIFAALHSAKVMVALGTKAEYFNAVWVKNEWSRFLALIKAGERKTLIPAYKDMDPYDLPEEFSHLQAQDMSKLGFMSDLVRGINKILASGKEPAAKETVIVNNSGNASVAPLLKRAFMFLEDGEWSSADEYCEKVLDLDPENAEAYLGKLMAELKVRKRADLKQQKEPFTKSGNYQKACRFDKTIREELQADIAYIKNRNEEMRKEGIYIDACNLKKQAKSESDYIRAATLFEQIAGYKDVDKLASDCREQAQKAAEEESKIVDAIAKAVKEKNAGKQTVPLSEQLAIEKAKLAELQALAQSFDSVLGEIQNKEAEIHTIEGTIIELKANKKSLGLFAAKEKKQIGNEVKSLETQKTNIEKYIKSKTIELKGFSTRQELEAVLQQVSSKISELEAKIEEAANEENIELTFSQAIEIYNSDGNVLERFNEKYPKLVYSIVTIKPGIYITLGSYYQSSENSKEPIEWLILDTKEDNKALIISKYALDCYKYNSTCTSVTWKSCSLRKWLNGTFINAAFSDDEKKMIQSTKVTADKNPDYDTSPGNDTNDKVFLLSINEVNKYFDSDKARQCKSTAYAVAQGALTNGWWWLRSPGDYSHKAAYVFNDGLVSNLGYHVYNATHAVRPAMWVKIR